MDEHYKQLQSRFSDLVNYDSDGSTSQIDPISWQSPEGDTCLHYAAMRGDEEAIRMLIELGVNPNARGDMGNTALHYATRFGQESAARTLIDCGADRSIRNEFGKVPAEWQKSAS